MLEINRLNAFEPSQVLEIKRLNASTAALRSEMNKYEEQLEDCRKYKEFMDSITPPGRMGW